MKNSEIKAQSIEAMKEAQLRMAKEYGMVTKSGVQRITGLSLTTVRKNWKYLDQTPAFDENGGKIGEVSYDITKKPVNKPDWWRERDYYLDFHGEMGEQMYLEQYNMLGRALFERIKV